MGFQHSLRSSQRSGYYILCQIPGKPREKAANRKRHNTAGGFCGRPDSPCAYRAGPGRRHGIPVHFRGHGFAAGISYRLILLGIAAGIAAIPPPGCSCWRNIRKQGFGFHEPRDRPPGGGYHVIQSMIAVGSGRLLGKGLYQGTQNKLDFLPAQHTDFIFRCWGKNWALWARWCLSSFFPHALQDTDAARQAKDRFGYLIVIGVLSMFTFQIFENIGMTIGIMPITGLTLPFVSYGGSSLLANMLAIGLVINVGMRRQRINF